MHLSQKIEILVGFFFSCAISNCRYCFSVLFLPSVYWGLFIGNTKMSVVYQIIGIYKTPGLNYCLHRTLL